MSEVKKEKDNSNIDLNTSALFTQVSNVLRDNLIVELKKSNDFLRNHLSSGNGILHKYKVIIERHVNGMTGEVFSETNGVLLFFEDYGAVVLYKDENGKNKMKKFYLNNITIVDERIEEVLN